MITNEVNHRPLPSKYTKVYKTHFTRGQDKDARLFTVSVEGQWEHTKNGSSSQY